MNLKTLTTKLLALRRFSLRTGLLAFLLIGISLGITGRWVQDIRRRGVAQRRIIAKCGEYANYPYVTSFERAPETKTPWLTTQLRQWVDREYGYQNAMLYISCEMLAEESTCRDLQSLMAVSSVSVSGVYPPEQLVAAFQIPGLKELTINGVILAEDESTDWSGVAACHTLETINFSGHYLSDELAKQLAKLPHLKNIRRIICSAEALVALASAPNLTELTVSGGSWRYIVEEQGKPLDEAAERAYFHHRGVELFARLAKCEKLQTLSLQTSLHLDPADLAEFCSKSPVTKLTLIDGYLRPECLAEFAKLPNLKELTLTEDQIDDQSLLALAGAQHLTKLDIRGNTTLEGVEALRKLLPQCLVNGQKGPSLKSDKRAPWTIPVSQPLH